MDEVPEPASWFIVSVSLVMRGGTVAASTSSMRAIDHRAGDEAGFVLSVLGF